MGFKKAVEGPMVVGSGSWAVVLSTAKPSSGGIEEIVRFILFPYYPL